MNPSILFQILQSLGHIAKPIKPCPRLCELQTLQFLPGNRQTQIKNLNAADKQCNICRLRRKISLERNYVSRLIGNKKYQCVWACFVSFFRFGNFCWILRSVDFPCYLRPFEPGNCHFHRVCNTSEFKPLLVQRTCNIFIEFAAFVCPILVFFPWNLQQALWSESLPAGVLRKLKLGRTVLIWV